MVIKDKGKGDKKSNETSTSKGDKSEKTSSIDYSGYAISSDKLPPRYIELNLTLCGESHDSGEFVLLALFNNKILISEKWANEIQVGTDTLPLDLNSKADQNLVLSNPLVFILRFVSIKSGKTELDQLQSADNRAGGTVDLLPLLLGEEEIFTTLHLVSKTTGKYNGCRVVVHAVSPGMTEHLCIPLLMTMISAQCMPYSREGTVYLSAIGLTDLYEDVALEFGTTLSSSRAKKVVWTTASNAGYIGNSEYNVSCQDKFVPDDLNPKDSEECLSFQWNTINRILVDKDKLIQRLASPFLIEVAGVPIVGKVEVRGRYLGWADARVLLEPGQLDVTVCVQLYNYSEAQTNDHGPLLNLPITSAKTTSARDSDIVIDEFGHSSYVIIRFDLMEPLVPKRKFITLYDIIGFPPPENPTLIVSELDNKIKAKDPFIDAKFMRKAGSALAVHEELSNLACRGAVPMNQSIKRSAANLLLTRVRTMLKNFPPGNCSYIDWQDTVTGQHSASRQAVIASFAPQPPPPRLPDRVAAARCRIFGDNRLAEKHISMNLKADSRHPRSLICKVLRCLEELFDLDAKNYLFDALGNQVNNRYLLWILGAQEYDKGAEAVELASAAFKIAVKGDYSDGTTNTIAWAALHTFYHSTNNIYSAHVAAKRMRKSFLLPREWKLFLKRWRDTSGEEEVFWNPEDISSDNPILITAAFFLCLRCYKFCESLLDCVNNECATRGTSGAGFNQAHVYYLRAASCILRKQLHLAMEIIDQGIKKFGPSSFMSQIRMTCLANTRSWDDVCERALQESEKAGATVIPSVYYKAALGKFKTDPHLSLQRAARCHHLAPSAHTALLIGRIYEGLGNETLAQRWCAVAVKNESLLSDAWAMLALIAMKYEKNLEKARTLLRTAKQVGPISMDIEKDVIDMIEIVQLNKLPDCLVNSMFCGKRTKS